MPSDEKVETVARAICASDFDGDETVFDTMSPAQQENFRVNGRAVLAALAAAEAGEPVAWRYELAGAVTHNPDGSKTGVNWKTHINASPPCVPDWGVRNLTPLFASPPSEASTPAYLSGYAGDTASIYTRVLVGPVPYPSSEASRDEREIARLRKIISDWQPHIQAIITAASAIDERFSEELAAIRAKIQP